MKNGGGGGGGWEKDYHSTVAGTAFCCAIFL